jgi:hypothetical protein
VANPDFEVEQAKWRDLVGGFILAFGDVELITHRLWRDHCQGKPPVLFRNRTEKLLSVLTRMQPRNDEVISCLVEALGIAPKRNTIAHNPMQAQVFQHSRTGRVLVEMAISSATSEDYIDDAELKELLAKTEDLVTRLYIALGFIAREPRVG